jgi:hypothetical protein
MMGAVDTLHLSGYSAQVSGVLPTLSIFEHYSNDRYIWYNTLIVPVINAISLSTTGETRFQGMDPYPGVGRFAYGRLQISIGPAGASGFLRIWVTGRDRSRRSAAKYQGQPNQMVQTATSGYAPKA